MDHNFWFAIWQALATIIGAGFAAYHGGKQGSK